MEVSMPTIKSAGADLRYEVVGQGYPLVLLHGLSIDGTSWRLAGYLDELSARYRCLVVDSRGAGGSDKPDLPALYSLAHHVEDVMRILDHERVDECAVWGFSLGGAVGFALAAWHAQRVRAVVATGAFDTQPYTLQDIRALRPRLDAAERGGMSAMLATWEGEEEPPLPPWFRDIILNYDHRAWLAARYGAFGWPQIPPSDIAAPTLLIVGSREDPNAHAPAWAAKLPDARCVMIADRTHCGTFLAVTQCLAAARPFLDQKTDARRADR
jgi:pimeloyl-ACP methyl ester carboxylesterase